MTVPGYMFTPMHSLDEYPRQIDLCDLKDSPTVVELINGKVIKVITTTYDEDLKPRQTTVLFDVSYLRSVVGELGSIIELT